jgi:hypothetical protein
MASAPNYPNREPVRFPRAWPPTGPAKGRPCRDSQYLGTLGRFGEFADSRRWLALTRHRSDGSFRFQEGRGRLRSTRGNNEPFRGSRRAILRSHSSLREARWGAGHRSPPPWQMANTLACLLNSVVKRHKLETMLWAGPPHFLRSAGRPQFPAALYSPPVRFRPSSGERWQTVSPLAITASG